MARSAPAPAAAENPAAILINNALIFDGTSDELVVGNLLIVGSKIKQISPDAIQLPPGCQVIDARGVSHARSHRRALAYDHGGDVPEDNAAKTRNPIGRAMNKEAVQMFATPAEGILKDFVEFGDTGCVDHKQPPPHQRTHAEEHYAKLINRNKRYRRFRHANSLSKHKPTVLNLMTPRNLPLS
jgi:hypothetical protein